jgi:hypothetical protein
LLERFPLHIEGSVIDRSIGVRDSGINTTGQKYEDTNSLDGLFVCGDGADHGERR